MGIDRPTVEELRRMAECDLEIEHGSMTHSVHTYARALLAALPVVEAAQYMRKMRAGKSVGRAVEEQRIYSMLDAFDRQPEG